MAGKCWRWEEIEHNVVRRAQLRRAESERQIDFTEEHRSAPTVLFQHQWTWYLLLSFPHGMEEDTLIKLHEISES